MVLAPPIAAQPRAGFDQLRQQLVEQEIVPFGVDNPRVVQAIRDTPRHEFVPSGERRRAYFDMALPIGEGQTISPPFVVAYMTQSLDPQPGDKVLEIGTGSGYQAAVLSPLVKEVYSIEIVKPLGERAARTLKRLKYQNVFTKVGDGYEGWPEHAPFDKIIVTCSPENVPQALVDQLAEGGRMIVPLGERYQQTLYLFRKQDGKLVSEALLPTLFVPMTGAAEERRQVLPDPNRPAVRNGGFEESIGDGEKQTAKGWHYQRQTQLVSDPATPDGGRLLRLKNMEPGRDSQALQGLAIDGRKIDEIEISLRVRARDVRPGPTERQLPMLILLFYDQRRATIGEAVVGPWRGTLDWRTDSARVRVPPATREAIVRIALNGATGELDVDDVRLTVPSKKE